MKKKLTRRQKSLEARVREGGREWIPVAKLGADPSDIRNLWAHGRLEVENHKLDIEHWRVRAT